MNKKKLLSEISKFLVKKGVPNKPILEGITRGDGTVSNQLVNHHKRLLAVYDNLPLPLLKREYDILKYEVEVKGVKNANSSGDQKSDLE